MFGYDLMLYNEIENYQERIFAFIFILYMEILLVNKLSFNKFIKIINHLFQIGFIFLI